MIIAALKGGLGNQLFQYAAGRRLAHIHNTVLKLDTTAYYYGGPRQFELIHFNIEENIAVTAEINQLTLVKSNKVQRVIHSIFYNHKKLAPTHIQYNKVNFNPRILTLPDNVYLEGYWASEKYFKDIENIIRRQFTFRNPPSEQNQQIIKQISAVNSVSLHIRRGDYISDTKTNKTHGTCGLDYYNRCIEQICLKVKSPHFFVFSNDIDWCRNNLKVKCPINYVDHNNSDKAYEDLRLMSFCKHHITANSSFSWWGAWLAAYKEKIVFVPEKWFAKDMNTEGMIPDNWIKI
jgi:hypothetical protein